jgi:tetratricopeptide (TPR) repeat protein
MFELTGWLADGVATLELAVQCSRTHAGDPGWRRIAGEALAQQGLLLFRQGLFDQAKQHCRLSLELLRPFADPRPLAPPLLFLGVITFLDGDLNRAQTLLEELLACARAATERWYEAYAILNLGYIATLRGEYEPGYQQMSDGLALWREIGDPRSIALGLNFRSQAQVHLGYFAEAEQSLEESRALCEQVGDRWGLGTALRFLGLVALARGETATARQRLHLALKSFIGFTTGWDIALTLIYLGEAARVDGDLDAARQTLRNAFGQAMAAHSAPLALEALTAIADVHLADDAPGEALPLAAFVAAHPATTHETRSRAEHLMDAAAGPLAAWKVSLAREWAREHSLETIAL